MFVDNKQERRYSAGKARLMCLLPYFTTWKKEVVTMRLSSRLFCFAFLLIVIPSPARSVSEFRGLYVDAFHPGFKSHEEVTQMVAAAKAANFNALFVEVRKRGDAYYTSSIEPRAADITGPADYDPLADVIQQAHAVGLEVHAWVVPYEVSYETYDLPATHVSKAHPDWLMPSRDGKTTLDKGKIYVDPGLPSVQDYTVSVIREILTKYDVDGIQLENPRYPKKDSGYNTASLALFNQETGRSGTPEDTDEAWCQWRRSQITKLVSKIHDVIQELKPLAKLSASVGSFDPKDTSKLSLQEWDVWASRGLVDFVIPMIFASSRIMPKLASKASESAAGRHVYMGIGSYNLTASDACEQIAALSRSGALGVALFSYDYLKVAADGPEMVKMADLASVFSEPVSIPTMAWKQEEGGEE
jgi:uncharacterized lipoprotein YddW (UPF0748 family)